jgi:hypothetical protein
MAMDKDLAQFYGTTTTTEEDMEKQAAANLVAGLENGELSIDDLDPDVLNEVAAEVLGEVAGGDVDPNDPGDGGQVDPTDDGQGQEKVAQSFNVADRMGRIMAHSFAQESRLIEDELQKTAGARFDAAKNAVRGAAGKVGDHLARVGGRVPRIGKTQGPHTRGQAMRRGAGAYAAGAAAAGGAAAGARKAFGGKDKKASNEAFENLAVLRAREKLEELGIQFEEQPQKTASAENGDSRRQVLAVAVDRRSDELVEAFLEEAGIDPATLQQ